MSRSTGSRLLIGVGAVLLAVALVAAYVRDTLVDSAEFGARAEAAFVVPEVRDLLTDQVVDAVASAEPELLKVRPLLETVVDAALRSDVATDIFGAAVTDLHRTVFTDADDTVTLLLSDLILVAKTQLTVLDPEIGALIPDDLTDAIVSVDTRAALVDTAQFAEDLRFIAWLLPILALLTFIAAIWLSDDTAHTVGEIGIATVVSAAVVLVAERVARASLTNDLGGDDAEVAGAIWDAFAGSLGTWALVLAGIGVILAALAWFGVGEIHPRARIDQLRRVTARRTSPSGRVGWSLATALAGLVLIVEWQLVLRFSVTVLGAGLIGAGVREIAVVVAPSLAEGTAGGRDRAERTSSLPRWTVTATLVLVGVLAVIAIGRSGGDEADATTDPGCNGTVLLCERSLPDITLAATHNSNAAAGDDYTLGYQTVGIVSQLDDGVRGLLVDVYFGLEVDAETVITDRAPVTAAERDELVADVGESAVASAEATQQRVGETGGRRALFLCHAFCELGSTPLVEELGRIKQFLDDHPREVIVMIIQDEGPMPGDLAEAFEESGLLELVYTHEIGGPWPTLGEMIDAEERIFVSAENRSGEFDWYHDAFTLVQDTPFSFESVDEFTCVLNRGSEDSPLLLTNHWLSPVSPSSADLANSADVLDERVGQCREERGRTPNLIAVDFHDRGDLTDTVRRANGL